MPNTDVDALNSSLSEWLGCGDEVLRDAGSVFGELDSVLKELRRQEIELSKREQTLEEREQVLTASLAQLSQWCESNSESKQATQELLVEQFEALKAVVLETSETNRNQDDTRELIENAAEQARLAQVAEHELAKSRENVTQLSSMLDDQREMLQSQSDLDDEIHQLRKLVEKQSRMLTDIAKSAIAQQATSTSNGAGENGTEFDTLRQSVDELRAELKSSIGALKPTEDSPATS